MTINRILQLSMIIEIHLPKSLTKYLSQALFSFLKVLMKKHVKKIVTNLTVAIEKERKSQPLQICIFFIF